ncbi:hypothetical protein JL720_7812 [Aureococcus anophagefferens]|nr:hypothetical protein JL720_7812 [Aureococcus anophagefferens]
MTSASCWGGPRGRPGPLRIEVTRRDDDGYDYDVKVVGMGRIFSPKVLRDFQKLRLRAATLMGVRRSRGAVPHQPHDVRGALRRARAVPRGGRRRRVPREASGTAASSTTRRAWGEALAAERDGSPEDDGRGPKPHIYSLSRANDADKLVDHVKQRLKREEKDLASLQEATATSA